MTAKEKDGEVRTYMKRFCSIYTFLYLTFSSISYHLLSNFQLYAHLAILKVTPYVAFVIDILF